MKKQSSQLRAGIILSYINLGISFIIPFFYTPIMLRMLGQSEYGLYTLANSVVSYLPLLTFGFGSTIIRYLSKYRAENNNIAVQKIFGLFILLYCIIAVFVVGIGMIISFNTNNIFHNGLTNTEINKLHILIILMTFNTALSFPLSVFSSLIISYERYIFRKIVDMISTVVAPILNIIALYLGFASVGMTLVTTILQFLLLPLNIGYCFKVLKIYPKFGKVNDGLLREMFGFSFYIFLGTLVDSLFWSTDKVILGMLASSTAVAIYNVGGTFNNLVTNLSTSISGVFAPKITGMVAMGEEKEKFTELFIKIGRLQYLIIALVISGFTVFGQAFIRLWAGSEYADAYWVAILTMFSLCIPLIQNIGLNIIIAENKHKFRSILYLIIAVLNVISTYLLVPYMGIIGAALCSCISYLLGQGVIMNIYYYRIMGINIPLFWKNICRMSIVPVIMLLSGLFINSFIKITSWKLLLCCIFMFTLVYGILMYVFTMNDYEKDIIRNPICKFVKNIKHLKK